MRGRPLRLGGNGLRQTRQYVGPVVLGCMATNFVISFRKRKGGLLTFRKGHTKMAAMLNAPQSPATFRCQRCAGTRPSKRGKYCLDCRAVVQKQWRAAHYRRTREKCLAYQRAYYRRKKEKVL